MAAIQKNNSYEAVIIGMTSEGNGVARIDGFAVFIPNTAIGDRVKFKAVKVLAHYGYGIVEEILTPSPDRIENDCPVFEQCGGCCYRHISYEAECRLKQQQVQDAFARLGGITLQPEEIVGGKEASAYRNKAQFPIGLNSDKKAVTGFFASRSHRIVKSDNCKLLPPLMNEIARDVVRFINKNKLKVYDEKAHTGVFRHVYLRYAKTTGQVMVCIVSTAPNLPKEEAFVQFLTSRHPKIHTIVVNHNPHRTNVILGEGERVIYGDGVITDTMCGVTVEISPKAFYQVNHDQAQRLYEQAIDYAQLRPDETLLDLYCGIGTIGLSAAERVKLLIGAEIIPEAVKNAERNASLNGFENTRFLCADCSEAVKTLETEDVQPDVLIVDPPRKGCAPEVLDTIVRFQPSRVVMVSCNASTAARDCKYLEERGYRVEKYRPFDLFPRTKHTECVVLLHKNENL